MSVLKLAVGAKINLSILPLSTREWKLLNILCEYMYFMEIDGICLLLVKQRGFTALHNQTELLLAWKTRCNGSENVHIWQI